MAFAITFNDQNIMVDNEITFCTLFAKKSTKKFNLITPFPLHLDTTRPQRIPFVKGKRNDVKRKPFKTDGPCSPVWGYHRETDKQRKER